MIPVVCDAFRVARGGGNLLLSGTICSDIFAPGWDCHPSPFPQEIFPLAFIFSLSQLREQNSTLTTFVVSGGQVPKSTLRLASNPTPEGKILLPGGHFFVYLFVVLVYSRFWNLKLKRSLHSAHFCFFGAAHMRALMKGERYVKFWNLFYEKTQYHTKDSLLRIF